MKVAQKHAHRTDLRRGVARSADEVFTPTAPQGEQAKRTVIKSSQKAVKSAKERLDVRIRRHQRLLSLKQEQFVHTGHFSLCVIYHFSSLPFFSPLRITAWNTVHMGGLSVPALFAVAKQPRSVSPLAGSVLTVPYQRLVLPAHADVAECSGCRRPPKTAAPIKRGAGEQAGVSL